MTRTEAILQDRHQGAYTKAVPTFDGATFDQDRDGARLGDQMAAVLALMQDGFSRTLWQIAQVTQAPESSVSARLRDLRKPRFGGHTVTRDYIGKGVFAYTLILRESKEV